MKEGLLANLDNSLFLLNARKLLLQPAFYRLFSVLQFPLFTLKLLYNFKFICLEFSGLVFLNFWS